MPPPTQAAGSYRLDYSGVYGTGRIDMTLQDGKVNGLNPRGPGPSYQGSYRQARDPRHVQIDLVAYLPPTRQVIGDVIILGTARQVPVRLEFPVDLDIGGRWPVHIETQAGPITGEITRLP